MHKYKASFGLEAT